MKIGIITIHNSPNYGACMQSYGLYHYLLSTGLDCEVIDLHRPTHDDYVESKKFVVTRKNKKNNLLKRLLLSVFPKKRKRLMTDDARTKFDEFNAGIRLSAPYCGIDALYKNPPIYDVYISGSDQLWNPTIGFCNEPYFLTFVKNNGKRISYATSLGINQLTDAEKNNYRKWLQTYSHISVRENSAKQLLSSFIDREVEQVADPSFLPDRDHWKSLSATSQIESPYILLFTLSFSEELLSLSKRLMQESGKNLIYICLNQPASDGTYTAETDAGPKEWLGYIANADLVITDSFHGTVFSIIMQANNFYTYVPSTQKRGKRITDLLETFKLSDHVFGENDLGKTYKDFAENSIDKSSVTDIYLSEQKRSRSYLINAINN